jgi:hypothetical protein
MVSTLRPRCLLDGRHSSTGGVLLHFVRDSALPQGSLANARAALIIVNRMLRLILTFIF